MKKYNIEYDLFRILKSKNSNEIYYVILNMVNNTYKYEIRYLNRVPYEELMVYLEKFIVIGSKCTSFDTLEDTINAILKFSNNLEKLNFRKMRNNTLLNIKYSTKVVIAKLKTNSLKLKISGLLLAGIIFISLYGYDMKATYDESYTSDLKIDHEMENDINTTKPNEFIVYNSEENRTFEEIQELNNDEKIEIILNKFNLTESEFDILCAIAITEAKVDSYEDAYAVINTIYNRTITNIWIEEINKLYTEDVGKSLYYQAIHPNQFVVYQDGDYLKNLNVRNGNAFQAIIDFLYTIELKHDYLSFRSADTELDFEHEQFVTNGNRYFNKIREEDRIIETELLAKSSR